MINTNDTFTCDDCGQTFPIEHDGGTGYGQWTTDGITQVYCYSCCSKHEHNAMLATGRALLYDCDDHVTDWPGTLRFHVTRRTVGRHNIAGKRYDVWFKDPAGAYWHGIRYGDNTQILHCRRLAA